MSTQLESLGIRIVQGYEAAQLEPRPDVVVCVVDATNLLRHLFLASQIAETGLPVIIALNMMDAAKEQGLTIDVELLRKRLGVPVIAVTGRANSALARGAHVVLSLGPLQEACPLGLAPSTSTTAMLALGDALALVTMRLHGFGHEDFARVHPAGALGRRLSRIEERMRPLAECRVARESEIVRDVFAELVRPGRRSGAIMLVDDADALVGIFTDSDLARLFEQRRDDCIDQPISRVMTRDPCTVPAGSMLTDAVAILAERKISELPVIDARRAPVGLLDITDVLAMLPDEAA